MKRFLLYFAILSIFKEIPKAKGGVIDNTIGQVASHLISDFMGIGHQAIGGMMGRPMGENLGSMGGPMGGYMGGPMSGNIGGPMGGYGGPMVGYGGPMGGYGNPMGGYGQFPMGMSEEEAPSTKPEVSPQNFELDDVAMIPQQVPTQPGPDGGSS